MAGIDLTDRIKMINKQSKFNSAPIQSPEKEPLVVPKGEDIDVASEVEKTSDITMLDVYKKVEELAEEIKKMNKHVNSIQKFIKKGK